MEKKPVIVAHRVNSRRRALYMAKHGVQFVEIDIRMKNNTAVVEHGVDTSSFRRNPIARLLGWLGLKLLTVGDPIAKPMTLEEYLNLFAKHFRFWFDVKDRPSFEVLLKLIEKYDVRPPIFLSSGYYDMLKKVKNRRPDILVFLGNVSFYPVDTSIVRSASADGISIHYSYVDKNLVEMMHRENIYVAVWTVNDIEIAKEMVKLGVDVLITDYPLEIGEAVSSLSSAKLQT